jgi:uncharacterized protein involved in response to NO
MNFRATARRVLTVPHRMFFLMAVTQLVVVSAWWAWALAARYFPDVFGTPHSALPATHLHTLFMIYGFLPFFMFGFLFTAGPRWLSMPPPPARRYVPGGVLASLGVLGLLPANAFSPISVALALCIFLAGWLWNLVVFANLIFTSRAPERVHATLIAVALGFGASGLAAAVVAVLLERPAAMEWARIAGIWFFLLPVFVTVSHRMIPFFTASVVPMLRPWRPWWLLSIMLGGAVGHGVLEILGQTQWTWLVDAPIAFLLFDLSRRWGLAQSMANRLLAMLHIGFFWQAMAFALYALHSGLLAAGHAGIGQAPLHALTIGFCSSLMLAMVTRVTCGHSGRTLAADTLTWRLFMLLQLAVVTRIFADVLFGQRGLLLGLAIGLWCACMITWSIKYAPLYWRARADGMPG